MTYTYTRYWTDDSLDPIRTEAKALRESLEKRRPFIDSEAAVAMEQRLAILETAIELMGEPVPGPFGG